MELYIVDAFTNHIFHGNQAGVVLLGDSPFPEDSLMQKVAAELKYSETVFVKLTETKTYKLRYFTPEGEVDLCGHATVSAFTVLRNEKGLSTGNYIADTKSGRLNISVEPEQIWMEMTQCKILKYLTTEESSEIYKAYGLDLDAKPNDLKPCIVSCGLTDILLPVNSREQLYKAVQRREEVIKISKEQQVVGVHMCCCEPSSEFTAYCRNFAPLFGIDEEDATGTSNGSLTYYLYKSGLINENSINTFMQGKSAPASVILSKIVNDRVFIGGTAVVSVSGSLRV